MNSRHPDRNASSVLDTLAEAGQRSTRGVLERLARVRASVLLIGQAGIAAALAWLAARDLIGHRTPFFAPIAAVIVLNVSVGQRLRRAAEMVVGVALGIFVGDLLIRLIGVGPIQIGVAVAVAITAAVFLGGSAMVIGQAASSAVLVATLAPPASGIYYSRFVDALIGGLVGLLVMALLLPVNPLTVIRRNANAMLEVLADGVRDCARAMTQRDLQPAQAALSRMRAGDATVVAFRDSLVGAARTATIVPVRWRSRAPLAQYVEAADHLDRAMRNARVLARRTVALLRDGEDLPEPVPAAVGSLADAVDALRQELAAGHEPRRCPQLCVQAMRQAAEGYRAGVQLSGGVVVGQVRSAAADLLRACGLSPEQAQRAARRVTGGAIQAAALGFGP